LAKKADRLTPAAIKGRQTKYTIFISHSSQDRWIASVMAEKIRAVGAEVWLDEKDLEGGDVLVERIIQGIDVCAEAIILISPDSTTSQWVVFEAGVLRGSRKRVTPVLNRVSSEAIAPLKDVKAIELNQFDDFLGQLKKRISDRERSA